MTNFKKYLSYRLKNTAFRTVVIAVICTVFVCVYILDNIRVADERMSAQCCADAFAWMTLLLASVIPMLETYHLKNVRTLDVVFSLPVRRRDTALAHYLAGAIQLAIISLAMAAATFILLLIGGGGYFNVGYVIPMYLAVLFLSLCVYSFVIFIFGKGNTPGDGAVFVFGFYGAVIMLLLVLDSFIGRYMYVDYFLGKLLGSSGLVGVLSVFNPMNTIIVAFESLIEARSLSTSSPIKAVSDLFSLLADAGMAYPLIVASVVWLAIGVACTLAYMRHFERYRAECAGDISDSLFGYRFIIPAFGFTIMYIFKDMIIFLNVATLAAMLIGYFIYRRSFKIKLSDLIMVALSLVFIFI